jgi:hypothetical protein
MVRLFGVGRGMNSQDGVVQTDCRAGLQLKIFSLAQDIFKRDRFSAITQGNNNFLRPT